MNIKLIGRVTENRAVVGYRVKRLDNGEQFIMPVEEVTRIASEGRVEGVGIDRNGKIYGIKFRLNELPSEKKYKEKTQKETLQSKRSIEERYNRILMAAADDGTLQGILQGCRNMVLLNMPPREFKRKKCERFDATEQTVMESTFTGNQYIFVIGKMDGTMNRLKPIGEAWSLKIFKRQVGEKEVLVKSIMIREHDCKDGDCQMPVKERMAVVIDLYEIAKREIKEIYQHEKQLPRL